jgi:hypothetical protein
MDELNAAREYELENKEIITIMESLLSFMGNTACCFIKLTVLEDTVGS